VTVQVLVGYFSKTGNTRALAEAVADGVRGVEGVACVLKDTSAIVREDFLDSRGVILGSPVYFGTMAAELKAVIDRFLPVRKKMEKPPSPPRATPPAARRPLSWPSWRPC
jgi:NAD(P)H dehydrogenase (quinone)